MQQILKQALLNTRTTSTTTTTHQPPIATTSTISFGLLHLKAGKSTKGGWGWLAGWLLQLFRIELELPQYVRAEKGGEG